MTKTTATASTQRPHVYQAESAHLPSEKYQSEGQVTLLQHYR
jgi:hypothetical protein